MIWRRTGVRQCSALNLDESGSAVGRGFGVVHPVGGHGRDCYHSISVCVPRDKAGPHQALVGSHAPGMRVSTESTGVIGGR